MTTTDTEIGKTDDLATLADLEEASLLRELKARYQNDNIYTYIGDILVAVNPYKDLGLYTKEISERYKGKRRTENPPHLFSISDSAYQSLQTGSALKGKVNQCIVISGESGAGKTESTKLIIKQLIELCKGKSQLETQILQVNPLLEAFGNAQTVMNDNSSRFGKYIQLKFQDAKVKGAKISEYLLEKSRVIFQNPKEENFHIFYYMFAGLSKEKLQELQLENPEKYKYLGNGLCRLKSDPEGTKQCHEELVDALNLVGFLEEEQDDMYRILAGVLTMGQIEVYTNENEEAFVRDVDILERTASILGIENQKLINMLTYSTSRASGEFFTRNYSKEQAHNVRDALAKALYGRLFSWIVNKINQLLASEEALPKDAITEIGILDIFGFENLYTNSFEQVCINLANEQLQNFFNQHIFLLEQAEYMLEGIDWTRVPFVNNQTLLDLFMAKPISVLALLDEESNFPKGSDHSYVEKMNQNFVKDHHYVRSKVSTSNRFNIEHYAGRVEYDATGFLEKNRDTLPLGAMPLLKSSNVDLISTIFAGTITRTGTLALQHRIASNKHSRRSIKKGKRNMQNKKLTVGAQFKNSLSVLMELLNLANPHFVRCIKPNMKKDHSHFDDKFVNAQLRYTGMLETTRIRKMGYALRPRYADFVKRYNVLAFNSKLSPDPIGCKKILEGEGLTDWLCGKTKLFLKYYHQDQLENKLKLLGRNTIHIQKIVRGFLARRLFARMMAKYRKELEDCNAFLLQMGRLSLEQQRMGKSLLQQDKSLPKKFLDLLGAANGEIIAYDVNNPPLTPPPSPMLPERLQPATHSVPEVAPVTSLSYTIQDPKKEQNEQNETMPEEDEEEESESTEEEDEDQEVEVEEDVFVKKKTLRKSFGGPKGTASKRWFQETQYVGLKDISGFPVWFHGVISRRNAERLLADKNLGAFLIRVSESRFGYSVSIKAEDRSKHFAVDQLRNKRYIVVGEEKTFSNLKELVRYYRMHPISPYGDKFKEPVGQEGDECDYEELVQGVASSVSKNTNRMSSAARVSVSIPSSKVSVNEASSLPPPLPPKSKFRKAAQLYK